MKHLRLFLSLTFLLVAVVPASAGLPKTLKKPYARDPMSATIHRLDNGLTVYLSPNSQDPRITAWIGVRAGSAQDPEDSTGMAHYLEHMLFKGSEKLGTLDYVKEKPHLDRIAELYEELFKTQEASARSEIYAKIDAENREAGRYAAANEVSKAYKRMGFSGINAFTGSERTVYICEMPKNRLEAWAKLEADRFAHPVFRLFQTEIEAVYEEKNVWEDRPGTVLWNALVEGLYGSHAYGRDIIGTIEHLKNPSLAKMYAFYDKYYVPGNMAVALAGDFDEKEALRVIEKYFGDWKGRKFKEEDRPEPAKLKGVVRKKVSYEAEEVVAVAWRTVDKNHPDADALTALKMVMDNSESGIINLRLNQAQKVKEAGSFNHSLNRGGMWALWAVPKQGQSLGEAEKLLMETVDLVKDGEFGEEDLDAIVTDFEISQKEELESNAARAGRMMDAFVSYREWDHYVDFLKRLRKVRKKDVVRVAKKYLGRSRVVVWREKGKAEIASIEKPDFTKLDLDPSRESAFFREIVETPAAEIAPKWLKPGRDYQTWKIPSGRLFAVKNPVNDLFAVTFDFERGSRHARKLCAALSLLELSGGGAMSAEEFKRELYRRGIRFSVGCGRDASYVSLRGLESRFEDALRLMRLRFAGPNVAPDTLAKMIEVELGKHKDNRLDPKAQYQALAGYASRGKDSDVLAELTDAEVSSLNGEELVGLLKSVFDYERRVLYVGVREPKDVVAALKMEGKDYLPAPERVPVRYVKPEKPRVVFLHRDMNQSQVGMYAADGAYDPAEAVDYDFYRTYMGGGMNAVVFQEVREARSLAYTAWGGYVPGDRPGDENRVLGVLGTQADKTTEAAALLSSLLRRMPESEERFAGAKNQILEGYRTNPLGFREIPGAVMAWRDRGIFMDPRPDRMARSERYALADLAAFAARFKESPLTLYILGNKPRLDLDGLRKLGDFSEVSLDDVFPY